MRIAIIGALVLAACSFELRAGVGPIDASDGGGTERPIDSPFDSPFDSAIDAAIDAPIDAMIDAPGPDANMCFQGAWCRRKTITIDAARVSAGPHSSFPVLIRLPSDANLAADARADGFDLLFTASDGITKIPHQRQRFVKATGELIAWVEIPTLSSSAPTVIHLYYGNPNATDQEDVASTWDSGTYKGVWHLEETSTATSALRDATTFGNHATPTNAPTLGAAGMIGLAVGFDGADDSLNVPDSASLDSTTAAGTFSMWVHFFDPSVSGKFQFLMTTSNAFSTPSDGYSWAVQPDGDHYFYPRVTGNNYNVIANPFVNATWHHAQVTFSFATKLVALYVDGTPRAITTMGVNGAQWAQQAQPANWLFGSNPADAANDFAGFMDEIRVQATVRSAGWILTEYRNQSSPSTFYAVGAAVSLN